MNEKLNTWRKLQDLPLAVTSFWCRFNLHTWTKWSEPIDPNRSIFIIQTRSCVHCNKLNTSRKLRQ